LQNQKNHLLLQSFLQKKNSLLDYANHTTIGEKGATNLKI
jgi:hypothetical protein